MLAGSRDGRVDLIRGVAILLVLFHHFNLAYRLDDTTLAQVLGSQAMRAVARNGNYGVTMFFAVSGFLITSNARRRWGRLGQIDAPAFYRLRAARILPCLLLLLAVVDALGLGGVAIFQNHPETGPPVSNWLAALAALTFWMNVLMASAGWFNYALCALWSLSVEEVFYLAFPLLCLALRRDRWIAALLAVFIAMGPVWRLTHQDDETEFLYAGLACFDGIAIGCCAALCAQSAAVRRWATAVQPGVVVGMTAVYLMQPIAQSNVWGVSAMAFGTAVLLVAGRPSGTAAGHGLLRGVRGCGRLSYELYLFHLVVLGALRSVSPPESTKGDTKLALLLVFVAGSVGVATLLARYYAEPLNRRIRQRFGLQREGAVAAS